MLKPGSVRFISPMLSTLTDNPPAGDKWLHEIKHDGYRTQLVLSGSERHAYTRNGLDWSDRYRFLLADGASLSCSSAIIDGEVIVQDSNGRSDFDALQLAIDRTPERLVFYGFDLLHLDGGDFRDETVLDRRSRLEDLIGDHNPGFSIQFSEHVIGNGPEFYDIACASELEGVVSKKITSRYRSGRTKAWVKTKSFVEGEFIVIGHKRGNGTASLALLAREAPHGLEYAGSAFVTLSDREREHFWRSVERLLSPRPDVAGLDRTQGSWVRPELRVKARYLRCSGKLRHATLTGVSN